MLVLTRRVGESLVIGGGISITIVEIRGDRVRLGVTCPAHMSVHRQEVLEAIFGEGGTPLTEVGWDVCPDPRRLLRCLGDRASPRKARLFAAACCRRLWDALTDEGSRRAVEVLERYADGLADAKELQAAHAAAAFDGQPKVARTVAYATSALITHDNPDAAAVADSFRNGASLLSKEAIAQAVLVRDLFANPWHPPPCVAPAWLAWNDGTVPKLARAIYDQRAFDRLPILADALEDAGCTEEALLAHCRQPGEHARGCWAVDLILERE